MSFWYFAFLFFAMVFGVGSLAIVLDYMQKIATIKAMAKDQHAEEMRHQLEELRAQVAEIRQMHTDHVLNIDNHIQHLDYKIAALTSRLEQIEQAQSVRH